MGIRNDENPTTIFVHPTFLYESLWNVLGFVLINLFYKKKKFDGQIFVMYLTWYGFGRMLIEGLRTDSLYVGPFRISQVIGFLCFFIGLCFLTAMEIVQRLRKKDALAPEAEVKEEMPEVKEEIKEENKDSGVFEIADNYSGDDDDDE
jgi:phosphatidylglycerol:prolipoprotein diacylglycerol transferase